MASPPTAFARFDANYDGGTPGAIVSWEGRQVILELGRAEDGGGEQRGQLGVYEVTEGATLLYAIQGERDYQGFGGAVAAGRDLNLDGAPDLAVGALDATLPPYVNAAVYIYDSPTLTGPGEAKVIEGWGTDFFGGFFDFVDDSVVVGTPDASSGGLVVIPPSDDLLRDRAELECYSLGPEFGFGNGVSSAGDVDGDGVEDVLVGGEAKSFFVDGFSLLQDCAVDPVQLNIGELGSSRHVPGTGLGDTDGDGRSDFVVAVNDLDEGRAFVFTNGSGTATGQVVNIADNQDAYDVARAGDLDGDGRNDFYLSIQAWDVWTDDVDTYTHLSVVAGPVCGSVGIEEVSTEVVGYPEGDVVMTQSLVAEGAMLAFGLNDLRDEPGNQTMVFTVE